MTGHVNWFVEYNKQYSTHLGESGKSLFWIGGSSEDMRGSELSPDTEGNTPRFRELHNSILLPLYELIQGRTGKLLISLIEQVEGIAELLPKRDRP